MLGHVYLCSRNQIKNNNDIVLNVSIFISIIYRALYELTCQSDWYKLQILCVSHILKLRSLFGQWNHCQCQNIGLCNSYTHWHVSYSTILKILKFQHFGCKMSVFRTIAVTFFRNQCSTWSVYLNNDYIWPIHTVPGRGGRVSEMIQIA